MPSTRSPLVLSLTALGLGLALAPLAAAQGSLALTVLPQHTQVTSGQAVRVAVTAHSTGAATATGVSTCLAPPSQLTVTRAAGAHRVGRAVCFTLGDLAPGTEATRWVQFRAASVRTINVRVLARSTSGCECTPRLRAWSPVIRVTPGAERPRVTG